MPSMKRSGMASQKGTVGVDAIVATQHDLVLRMGHKMVHHPIRKHRSLFDPVEDMGCDVVGWEGCGCHYVSGDLMGVQR